MVATKMFWDMWRNLTNATSNWTISSASSSSSSSSSSTSSFSWSRSSSSCKNKWSRYNRLRSPPTKSYSQPANLTALTNEETTSLDSFDGDDDGKQKEKEKERRHHQENISMGSNKPPTSLKKGNTGKQQQTIKHSFTTSSFLPFSFRTSSENECSSTAASAAAGNGIGKMDRQSTQASLAKGISSIQGDVARIAISGTESNSPLPIVTTAAKQDARQQKEEFCVVEHVISDLDEDEEGDDGYHLTCDVCDRAFSTFKDLADHQRKKRHYGCVQCDTLFPNREVLDIHREQMCHYEFAIDLAGYRDYGTGADDDDTDSFITDDDENGFGYSDDGDDEEMERLL